MEANQNATKLEEILNCQFDVKDMFNSQPAPDVAKFNTGTDTNTGTNTDNGMDKLKGEMTKLARLINNNTNYLATTKENNLHLTPSFDAAILLNAYTELLGESKGLLGTVTYMISSSSILDPETLNAASNIINSCRDVIGDMILIYRDHLKYKAQLQLQQLKGKQKLTEIKFKHDLQVQLVKQLENMDTINGECSEQTAYSPHEIFNNLEELEAEITT